MNSKKPISKSYELFILFLSLLSIFNILLYFFPFNSASKGVVQIVDFGLCLVFFGDFTYRIIIATSKKYYFINEHGWLDLLGSIPAPGLRFARFFRIAKSTSTIRRFGFKNMLKEAKDNKANSAIYVVVLLIVLVLEFGSIGMLQVESKSLDSNIHSASDALWYTYVTITTVGYGDKYPVTNFGRFIGVIVLTTGVGLFGVLTGFLANAFLKPKESEAQKDGVSKEDGYVFDLVKSVQRLEDKVEKLSKKS